MRINELANPRPYILKHVEPLEDTKKRMQELGLAETYPYLMRWIYTGLFKAAAETMDKFANMFYAIRSALPDEIIATYSKLPVLYRGRSLRNQQQLEKIYNSGLDIRSQISAWTPHKQHAIDYARTDVFYKRPGILLSHTPVESEVVLALNKPTLHYLNIDQGLVANKDEVILSLPVLKITPEMVVKVIK